MIEIKNKRMILYPEDRIIGASGDIMTAQKKFVLNAVQDGFDLSDFVAFIKLEPCADEAYDQLLKKQKVDGKLVLTWALSGANLKNAGELSAQIVLASPEFFDPKELDVLSDNELVVPAKIEGISAPVWQSFKETFIVDESIESTAAYKEISKNVLTAAIASVIENAEQCESLHANVGNMYRASCDNLEASEELFGMTSAYAQNAALMCERAENLRDEVEQFAKDAKEAEQNAFIYQEVTYDYEQSALSHSENAGEYYEKTLKLVQDAREIALYRPIFTKTIAEGDSYVSFEITQDSEGDPLNLCKFAIYAYIPGMPDASNAYLRIECKPNDDSSGYSLLSMFSGINRSETDMYFKAVCENEGRWTAKISKSNSWFQNAENATLYGPLCSNSRSLDGKAISHIYIGQHKSPINFPVGTYIEVWGVDAPEKEEG